MRCQEELPRVEVAEKIVNDICINVGDSEGPLSSAILLTPDAAPRAQYGTMYVPALTSCIHSHVARALVIVEGQYSCPELGSIYDTFRVRLLVTAPEAALRVRIHIGDHEDKEPPPLRLQTNPIFGGLRGVISQGNFFSDTLAMAHLVPECAGQFTVRSVFL